MGYKDELIEKSNERAQALVQELTRLEEHKNEVKRQLAETQAVLRALGAEGRTPLVVKHALDPESRPTVTMADGSLVYLDPTLIREILSWVGTWRTAKVSGLVSAGSSWKYLKHLKDKGLIEKVGHGRYQRVVKLERLPAREAPVGDESEPKLRTIDGVMTLEEPPERGYGR